MAKALARSSAMQSFRLGAEVVAGTMAVAQSKVMSSLSLGIG